MYYFHMPKRSVCCVWIRMSTVHPDGKWVAYVFGSTDLYWFERADLCMSCIFLHSLKWREMQKKQLITLKLIHCPCI